MKPAKGHLSAIICQVIDEIPVTLKLLLSKRQAQNCFFVGYSGLVEQTLKLQCEGHLGMHPAFPYFVFLKVEIKCQHFSSCERQKNH